MAYLLVYMLYENGFHNVYRFEGVLELGLQTAGFAFQLEYAGALHLFACRLRDSRRFSVPHTRLDRAAFDIRVHFSNENLVSELIEHTARHIVGVQQIMAFMPVRFA